MVWMSIDPCLNPIHWPTCAAFAICSAYSMSQYGVPEGVLKPTKQLTVHGSQLTVPNIGLRLADDSGDVKMQHCTQKLKHFSSMAWARRWMSKGHGNMTRGS